MSRSAARPVASVAEVFRSWQGEGLLLGRRQVFVRLAGCRVGCRYCDTAWAFDAPADVAVPGRPGERAPNPMDAGSVLALVRAAEGAAGPGAIALTGGEPLEQPDFVDALLDALAPRDVMLETAGLHGEALRRVIDRCRWIACDLKLPSATGLPDVLPRHAAVLSGGLLDREGVFFKLVVDGDVVEGELAAAADLLARHAPRAPVFLQPVTPLGGSPALPRERLDALADVLLARGLDLRVVPQVHKLLGVR
jgi:organic radical activating enzyme